MTTSKEWQTEDRRGDGYPLRRLGGTELYCCSVKEGRRSLLSILPKDPNLESTTFLEDRESFVKSISIMGKKSKKGHTRHAQHEHHSAGNGHHHHHKLTVHGHHESHEGDHDDALLDQLLDEFDVTKPNEHHDVASSPSDGKVKQSHLDQTPGTVASTPSRDNDYLQGGQEDEILDKLLDEFDDPGANQKPAPQTPQRKDEAGVDKSNNIKSSVVTSPRAHLGDVSEVVEVETVEAQTTPIRSLHYMSPTSTSLSREAQARKVRDERAATPSKSSGSVSKTPLRTKTKGTPHYMLPTSLSLAREHHEESSINGTFLLDLELPPLSLALYSVAQSHL